MSRPSIYVVPVDRWYIERAVWLVAGIVLLTSTTLAWLVDPRFIVFVITGMASVWVSLPGCARSAIFYIRRVFEDSSRTPRGRCVTSCGPTAGISNGAST
jgi:hypothetical protein